MSQSANPDSPVKSSALPDATDVVIIGGGPVGCALAIDLRQRGIDCVVIERETGISYVMRAMNNDMRTMEHFRRWGVADQLRAESRMPSEWQRDLVFCASLNGPELGVHRAYGFRPEDAAALAAEPGQPMPQKYTTRTLHRRAEELGAVMATGWQCTNLEQSDDGVLVDIVDVDDPTQLHRIRGTFAAGCDGGRSIVVELAGITRSGAGGLGKHLHVMAHVPDLITAAKVTPASFFVIFNSEVGGLAIPSDVDELNMHIAGFAVDEDTSDLDLTSLVTAVVGRDDASVEITSVGPYVIHQLVADNYRAGRVFIAGDAAHLFCPFGGFNMNTGISDVANLGWKLAANVQGWGGDALLESYSAERRPIAQANSAQATLNVERLTEAVSAVLGSGMPQDESPEADVARHELGQQLYDRTFNEWNTAGVVLDQRYTASPVIVDDGRQVPAWDPTVYLASAKPGHRAPHVMTAEGRPLYDSFGTGFTLLAAGALDNDVERISSAAQARGVPLLVVQTDDPRVREVYETPLCIIRPDQHVAWRGESAPGDIGAVLDTVCGRPDQRAPDPTVAKALTTVAD